MKKTLPLPAGFMALVYFLTHCALAHAVESNLWEERRRRGEKARPEAGGLQPASLPVGAPVLHLEELPAIQKRPFVSHSTGSRLPSGLESLLQSLPYAHGTVRKVSLPAAGSRRTVIHMQDVHMNQEAQGHIGRALQGIIDGKRADLIALEGTFEPLDLRRFREFPEKGILQQVADQLLRENKMSGPVHAVLTSPRPIPPVVGVDDRALYNANVEAYKQSAPLMKDAQERLSALSGQLSAQKQKTFSPALAAFDQKMEDYHPGKLSVGEYVQELAKQAIPFSLPLTTSIETFLQALSLESTLDFQQVETERAQIIRQLATKLDKQQTADLTNHSAAYRLGQIGYADFYSFLKGLCETQGVPLSRYKAMDAYVRYVMVADRIQAENLFTELRDLENKIYAALAQREEERSLILRSKQLRLTRKLLDFSLTSEEWEEYEGLKTSLGKNAVDDRSSLASFESFYRQAKARDQAMVHHLLAAMENENARVAVLVTGGFHARGMDTLLQKAGAATVSFVPKLTKIDGTQGSAYMSIFTQEKTPLENLFDGDRLFLSQEQWKPSFHQAILPTCLAAALYAREGLLDQARAVMRRLSQGLGKIQAHQRTASKCAVTATFATSLGSADLTVTIKEGVFSFSGHPTHPSFYRVLSDISDWARQMVYQWQTLPDLPVLNFVVVAGLAAASGLWMAWPRVSGWVKFNSSSWAPMLAVLKPGAFGFLISLLAVSLSIGAPRAQFVLPGKRRVVALASQDKGGRRPGSRLFGKSIDNVRSGVLSDVRAMAELVDRVDQISPRVREARDQTGVPYELANFGNLRLIYHDMESFLAGKLWDDALPVAFLDANGFARELGSENTHWGTMQGVRERHHFSEFLRTIDASMAGEMENIYQRNEAIVRKLNSLIALIERRAKAGISALAPQHVTTVRQARSYWTLHVMPQLEIGRYSFRLLGPNGVVLGRHQNSLFFDIDTETLSEFIRGLIRGENFDRSLAADIYRNVLPGNMPARMQVRRGPQGIAVEVTLNPDAPRPDFLTDRPGRAPVSLAIGLGLTAGAVALGLLWPGAVMAGALALWMAADLGPGILLQGNKLGGTQSGVLYERRFNPRWPDLPKTNTLPNLERFLVFLMDSPVNGPLTRKKILGLAGSPAHGVYSLALEKILDQPEAHVYTRDDLRSILEALALYGSGAMPFASTVRVVTDKDVQRGVNEAAWDLAIQEYPWDDPLYMVLHLDETLAAQVPSSVNVESLGKLMQANSPLELERLLARFSSETPFGFIRFYRVGHRLLVTDVQSILYRCMQSSDIKKSLADWERTLLRGLEDYAAREGVNEIWLAPERVIFSVIDRVRDRHRDFSDLSGLDKIYVTVPKLEGYQEVREAQVPEEEFASYDAGRHNGRTWPARHIRRLFKLPQTALVRRLGPAQEKSANALPRQSGQSLAEFAAALSASAALAGGLAGFFPAGWGWLGAIGLTVLVGGRWVGFLVNAGAHLKKGNLARVAAVSVVAILTVFAAACGSPAPSTPLPPTTPPSKVTPVVKPTAPPILPATPRAALPPYFIQRGPSLPLYPENLGRTKPLPEEWLWDVPPPIFKNYADAGGDLVINIAAVEYLKLDPNHVIITISDGQNPPVVYKTVPITTSNEVHRFPLQKIKNGGLDFSRPFLISVRLGGQDEFDAQLRISSLRLEIPGPGQAEKKIDSKEKESLLSGQGEPSGTGQDGVGNVLAFLTGKPLPLGVAGFDQSRALRHLNSRTKDKKFMERLANSLGSQGISAADPAALVLFLRGRLLAPKAHLYFASAEDVRKYEGDWRRLARALHRPDAALWTGNHVVAVPDKSVLGDLAALGIPAHAMALLPEAFSPGNSSALIFLRAAEANKRVTDRLGALPLVLHAAPGAAIETAGVADEEWIKAAAQDAIQRITEGLPLELMGLEIIDRVVLAIARAA